MLGLGAVVLCLAVLAIRLPRESFGSGPLFNSCQVRLPPPPPFAPSLVPSVRNRSTVHVVVVASPCRVASAHMHEVLRKLLELLHGFIDLGLLIVGHVWIRWTLIRLPGAH